MMHAFPIFIHLPYQKNCFLLGNFTSLTYDIKTSSPFIISGVFSRVTFSLMLWPIYYGKVTDLYYNTCDTYRHFSVPKIA